MFIIATTVLALILMTASLFFTAKGLTTGLTSSEFLVDLAVTGGYMAIINFMAVVTVVITYANIAFLALLAIYVLGYYAKRYATKAA